MSKNAASERALENAIDIGYLSTDEARFRLTPGGFLSLKLGDKEWKRVALRRALPVGAPDEYISVADEEKNEIGVIRAISQFPADQAALITEELDRRYYAPTVREVLSVKDKLGYVYMELKVSGRDGRTYERNCAIKDVNRNIRMLTDDELIIFDVDGNRYRVLSLKALDKKSLKKLEAYLY